jgi:hypothetical protein
MQFQFLINIVLHSLLIQEYVQQMELNVLIGVSVQITKIKYHVL